MVAAGDTAHGPARDDMKGRWKRPVSGMRWYPDDDQMSTIIDIHVDEYHFQQ